jgi:Flp pilus assembly protein TadD
MQFETAIRLKPTHAKAHHNLGSILYNKGRPDLAKSHYETALRVKPDYGEAEINLGILHNVGGRLAEAKLHLEAGLRSMPGNRVAQEHLSHIHNVLGAQFVQENNLADAKVQFELAIKINAANPGAHNNLAVVLWRTGFPQQAIPHFEEALRLSPDFADAKSGLADLKAQLRATQK